MQSLRTTVLLTAVTLVAFAANSVLCRMALADGSVDPVTFTSLRIVSGAAALLPWIGRSASSFSLRAAIALFVYALGFSLAYVSLDAGTGALLLFGCVQLTMLGVGRARGERLGGLQRVGVVVAIAGVAWLVAPGVSAPAPLGALLMGVAGIGWGTYSLLGRGASDPAGLTARNFVLAAPFALAASVVAASLGVGPDPHLTPRGATLALFSGALTSGMGYVLWYSALRGHSRSSAAVVQLAVPAIAAAGGALFLGEAFTGRLVLSGALTLGGVALAIRPARAASD